MTRRDIWGYEYLYSDGTFSDGKPLDGKELVYMSHYSENDGPAFIRNPDRRLSISFGENTTCERLEKLLQNAKINPEAKKLIDEMIKAGKLECKVFKVD